MFSARVLYDRPPAIFRPISIEDKHNLFVKLKEECIEFAANDINDENETLFTVYDLINDKISLKANRPALLISSTSWTEDEDFSILFEALEQYDSNASHNKIYPKLVCVITGKGPLKAYYQQKVAEKEFKFVKFVFLWLIAEDYPKLLASADIGISLHKSSSNLDLPMKVVDMFGSCLPVCAFQYDWYLS
jgi:beta-1,4-mannosyltransferase